eukprot:Sspe_Gene.81105::Locus_51683_Transcript_3_5_Confidence_0.375_Length_2201::g.81105::m.81105
MRWLLQDRVLRLGAFTIENVNTYTGQVTKKHSYKDVENVKLVDQRYLVISFCNDHDFHYKSPDAVRIAWEINKRINALQTRERYRQCLGRMSDQNLTPSKLALAFRTNRVPLPPEHEDCLAQHHQEVTELLITELLLNLRSDEGKAFQQVSTSIDCMLAKSRHAKGKNMLKDIRSQLQRLKDMVVNRLILCASPTFIEKPEYLDAHSLSSISTHGVTSLYDSFDVGSFNRKASTPDSDVPHRVRPRKYRSTVLDRKRNLVSWSEGGDGTEEELAGSVEAVLQRMLFRPRHARLWEEIKADAELREKSQQTAKILQKVRYQPPGFFGVSEAFQAFNFELAVKELNDLQTKHLPCEKQDCLVLLAKQICVACALEHSAEGQRSIEMSLDDILPLFLLCVSRSSLPDPVLEAEYMWCLTDNMAADERAYYLTVFSSALEYLMTIELPEATGNLNAPQSTIGGRTLSMPPRPTAAIDGSPGSTQDPSPESSSSGSSLKRRLKRGTFHVSKSPWPDVPPRDPVDPVQPPRLSAISTSPIGEGDSLFLPTLSVSPPDTPPGVAPFPNEDQFLHIELAT